MLTLRHLVSSEDGLLCANPAELDMLAYYANAIEHLRESGRAAVAELPGSVHSPAG